MRLIKAAYINIPHRATSIHDMQLAIERPDVQGSVLTIHPWNSDHLQMVRHIIFRCSIHSLFVDELLYERTNQIEGPGVWAYRPLLKEFIVKVRFLLGGLNVAHLVVQERWMHDTINEFRRMAPVCNFFMKNGFRS